MRSPILRCAISRLPVSMRAVQDKQQDDDDLEAILAELDGKPRPAQAPASMDSAAAPASAESVPTEPPAEDAENTAVSSLQLMEVFGIPGVLLAALSVIWCLLSPEYAHPLQELSAAAKKKLKKKAKEKAKKSGGAAADEPAEADEEQAAAPAPKKGGKKVSAAVRRMQEALERQEREAEEAAQMEAERRAAVRAPPCA